MTVPEAGAAEELGYGLDVGARHYRAWVGPPGYYDLSGALQFNFLTSLGLREYHSLLDVGCGSLRAGRLFLAYLKPGNYYGLDPEQWAVEAGIDAHFGPHGAGHRAPTFRFAADFRLSAFGRTFDYLIAHSIFTHASRSQIATCLAEARTVMTEHSLFAATFHESPDEDYTGDGWVYPEFAEYTRASFAGLVDDAGLRLHFAPAKHPWGQTWVVITRPESTFDVSAV